MSDLDGAAGIPLSRCAVCGIDPDWYLLRHGDAIGAWACDDHLGLLARSLRVPKQFTTFTLKVSALARVRDTD